MSDFGLYRKDYKMTKQAMKEVLKQYENFVYASLKVWEKRLSDHAEDKELNETMIHQFEGRLIAVMDCIEAIGLNHER